MKLPKSLRVDVVLISMLSFAWFTPSQAASISLQPISDTTLQQAFPNNNFGDGISFQAGGRRQGGETRTLMAFDIAGNLPAGATITAASLSVSVVGLPAGGVNSVFDLNRVTSSWGEGNGSDHMGSPGNAGQATWNNRLGAGSPWTSAGGDFSAILSSSVAITGLGSYAFSATAILIADVQNWLDTPSDNFGWILRSESPGSPTSIRRFGSRDASANSPVLTIQFDPPNVPEPAAFSLPFLGLAFVAWRVLHGRLGSWNRG